MKTKLIAEAGSTKIEWTLLIDGQPRRLGPTPGINPVIADDNCLRQGLGAVVPVLGGVVPDEVYYYGAGCVPAQCPRVASMLSQITGAQHIEVHSDLLAAARGLLGDEKGIICILGTGSNSGYYDGSEITFSVPSMGFILGDEGSGAVLGARLVGDVFKNVVPPELCEDFRRETQLTLEDVMENTYRRPAPNRFLASLVPFLRTHIDHPYVRHLVTVELCRFLDRNVTKYKGYEGMPLAFTGSVAASFEPQLRRAATVIGCTVGFIEASPLEGLIKYHLTH